MARRKCLFVIAKKVRQKNNSFCLFFIFQECFSARKGKVLMLSFPWLPKLPIRPTNPSTMLSPLSQLPFVIYCSILINIVTPCKRWWIGIRMQWPLMFLNGNPSFLPILQSLTLLPSLQPPLHLYLQQLHFHLYIEDRLLPPSIPLPPIPYPHLPHWNQWKSIFPLLTGLTRWTGFFSSNIFSSSTTLPITNA